MPSIKENVEFWKNYQWPEQGDEWSKAWGGPSSQWFGAILPRLRSFVPARRILEIAPGFGRWTQFLRPLCTEMILVDVSANCIEACTHRFAGRDGFEFHVNDGQSLAMVADGSIDLAFSFDSLVHVEFEVLDGYVAQLARKLGPDGIGFIHHSNLGELVDAGTGQLPPGLENRGGRAASVSADRLRAACEGHGLTCISQEMINWSGPELTDAISVVAPKHSRWSRPAVVVRNSEFMREAEYLARLAPLYDWDKLARG